MEHSRRLALTIAGFLFILRWTATGGINPTIKCNVHLFQTLESVLLVCQYNTSLTNRKNNYWIEFCQQNSNCSDAMSCNWDGTRQILYWDGTRQILYWDGTRQILYCVPGLAFKGMSCAVIDDQRGDLICLLPNVHSHHSGSYTCHLVPPDGRAQQSCAVIVPWEKKNEEEESKEETKSNSAHGSLQTTILIVILILILILILAVVIVTILFFIRKKLKKRKRRQSPGNEDRTVNPVSLQNPPNTSVNTMAENTDSSQNPPSTSVNTMAENTDSSQNPPSTSVNTMAENTDSSQNPPSTPVDTMAEENTERAPQTQSGQDVANHNETNDEDTARDTDSLLKASQLDSTDTTNKPFNVDNPSITVDLSTKTYTTNVRIASPPQLWVIYENSERKLLSPQDLE